MKKNSSIERDSSQRTGIYDRVRKLWKEQVNTGHQPTA